MNFFSNDQATTRNSLLPEDMKDAPISAILETNLECLQAAFGNTVDIRFDRMLVDGQSVLFCFLDSMTNAQEIDTIRQPLLAPALASQAFNDLEHLRMQLFPGFSYLILTELEKACSCLLDGYALLFFEQLDKALALSIVNLKSRGVEEPTTQTIIRGPKESFTENLQTNISLVRRRIKHTALRFESQVLGKDTHTSVVMAYMQNIANDTIVTELRRRLQQLQINFLMDSSILEESLSDNMYSPFPMFLNTERPDTLAASLIQGKVAVIVDGSPFAIIAPAVFNDFFRSQEDFYQPYLMSMFIRLIRFISLFLAMVLPAFYLAVTTYHQELIPSLLLIMIVGQREEVPFPTVVEVLLMEITFEIIREAGIRMPRAVGNAVSIVGTLVIGQAAVEAGIVSSVMVVIVSLTGIASFVVPIYSMALTLRLLRFMLILLSAAMGLYGMGFGLILIMIHLVKLNSLGIPYLTPLAPSSFRDLIGVWIRLPYPKMFQRSFFLKTKAPLYRKKK
ncbi:spore germination protein [Paenibacillus aestuarii]|uniref:Spore germination protein n=1 Tax=Paenibacillus aestuarii TaxID=516965 RepID=A0ABW0K9V7_9BACL|nr:spore germination protein [Paenibacillus aestuarii]